LAVTNIARRKSMMHPTGIQAMVAQNSRGFCWLGEEEGLVAVMVLLLVVLSDDAWLEGEVLSEVRLIGVVVRAGSRRCLE
jgi:hypothetical protein